MSKKLIEKFALRIAKVEIESEPCYLRELSARAVAEISAAENKNDSARVVGLISKHSLCDESGGAVFKHEDDPADMLSFEALVAIAEAYNGAFGDDDEVSEKN